MPGPELEEHATVELLLVCARTRMRDADIERACALVAAGVDWPLLVRRARHHRVSPLLYRSLAQCGLELVPPAVAEDLRADVHGVTLRNLQLAEETSKLAAALAAGGVRVLAFKGAPLAAMVYGDLALRVTGDIDLLVSSQDVDRAVELLGGRDYELRAVAPASEEERDEVGRGALPFHRRGGGFDLDLHWRLLAPQLGCDIGLQELWPSRRVVSTEVGDIPVVAGNALHVVLALQLAKDFWRGEETIKYLCDVVETAMAEEPVDWPAVLELSRGLGCERILLFAHALAARALRVEPAPELASAARRDRRVGRLVEAAMARLSAPSSRPRMGHDRHAAHLELRERSRDRLRYGLYVLARWWRSDAAEGRPPAALELSELARLPGRTHRWISRQGLRRALSNVARLISKTLR
jgi:hypothetical protein